MGKKKTTTGSKRVIGVGHADITPTEKRYVLQTLKNKRLSYGPFSAKFENIFSKGHSCRFGVFCNSGTSALQMAVACLKESGGWKDGDEVIVPALTFVATANVVIQSNLKPVFVDVDPLTYNIDPSKIQKAITRRTRAIIPVHLFGLPADMGPIMAIARKNKLKVIEDSCETMFVKYKGKSVGSFGDISCFSTYMAHIIVTGVGGLALTNNPKYAVMLRSMMNHGRDSIYLNIDDDKKKGKKKFYQTIARRFRFVRMGFSYRATEMEAALGLAQLERLDSILAPRKRNAAHLIKKLKPLENQLQLPFVPKGRDHAFMMFPVVLKNKKLKKRDLVRHLEDRGVETRDMVPLTNQPYFKNRYRSLETRFPAARFINNNGFYIGCHRGVSRKDLDHIVDVFHEFFKKRGITP